MNTIIYATHPSLIAPRWGSNFVNIRLNNPKMWLKISDYMGRRCLLYGSAYSASCETSDGCFIVNPNPPPAYKVRFSKPEMKGCPIHRFKKCGDARSAKYPVRICPFCSGIPKSVSPFGTHLSTFVLICPL